MDAVNISGDNVPVSSKPAAYHHGDLKRVLVEAACAIVAEEQNWDFSLREVARRAGVSHNAPYRHFPEKLDLLAAVAAEGFIALGVAMTKAADGVESPEEALVELGNAYVKFGIINGARYRLMFGTVLASSKTKAPALVLEAAARSQAILANVIAAGVKKGQFAASDDDEMAILVLSACSTVHGLTMLLIDGLSGVEYTPSLSAKVGQTLLSGIVQRSRSTITQLAV